MRNNIIQVKWELHLSHPLGGWCFYFEGDILLQIIIIIIIIIIIFFFNYWSIIIIIIIIISNPDVGSQMLPPGRRDAIWSVWHICLGYSPEAARRKKKRNPTSDFAARSGEHGAVRAADVVVAHFHAEVPLPHAARRHLHHAHVQRLQSHPPPLATSTARKRTWKLENQLVFLFITAGEVGVGKVGGRPN